MKTYRALQRGFDGDQVIEAGQLFTTGIPQGSWMEEVDSKTTEPVEETGEVETKKPPKRG